MSKGSLTQPIIILVAVIIISILGILIIYDQTRPSLRTSMEARALSTAHSLASYINGLSTTERGKVEKNLNGSFDIEIGRYSWSKRTYTSIKPLGNYYIKVTAYDEKLDRKRDSGQVPIVGELSITCGGTKAFKATKCEVFSNVSHITLSKEPNKPVEISPTKSFTISSVSIQNYFIAKYSAYKDAIEKSARDPNHNLTAYYNKPEALIAGLISEESRWNEKAVSPCGAAGIIQFVPGTARLYKLKVPQYPFEWCRKDICKDKYGNPTKVSSCNSCTPSECKPDDEDERFNPEKAIEAGTHHLYDSILRCGNVEGGLRMYNSGECHREAQEGYVSRVMSYAEEWKKYV
ncbi:MAG: transglycosylase SLT domain-containing protein [Candidatus Aenigmarchaeota archaeon]|nr:transglycosylase SLT domain-containing protein [Candidatus Aenigmarchaeota archaeon]